MPRKPERGWWDLKEQDKEDLTGWFNVRSQKDLSPDDKKRLARLFWQGRFQAWNCPKCGERIYRGNPEDWGYFQGVKQQDFLSYPGNLEVYTERFLSLTCDGCRREWNEYWENLYNAPE